VPNAPLTIVIPVLNERRLIASLLESLVPFRQRNVEVVVVDGAATMALTAAGLSR
jgi:glycosyltransferase involved in cell wall biosynthesis